MATQATELGGKPALHYGRVYVWEAPVRLAHWVDAISIVVLFATGLLISQPQLSPIGEPFDNFWMGRVREVHFIFAYLLTTSILLRVYWFLRGNRYARSGFPTFWRFSWWRAVFAQFLQYFRTARGRVDVGHNALAGASYAAFFALALFQMLTGFALFGQVNRGGFWDRLTGWVIPLLGGSYQTQMWHHLASWGFVVFIILHVYIVIYDSRLYRNGLIDAMISGFKFYEKGDIESE